MPELVWVLVTSCDKPIVRDGLPSSPLTIKRLSEEGLKVNLSWLFAAISVFGFVEVISTITSLIKLSGSNILLEEDP